MFIHTINIARLPLAPDEVTHVRDEIAGVIRFNHKWRAIKVIHSRGGISRTAPLKNVVRNWADRNRTFPRGSFRARNIIIQTRLYLKCRKPAGNLQIPILVWKIPVLH